MILKLDDKPIERGVYSPVCNLCKHYKSGYQCAAFDEIPLTIWKGRSKHKRPFKGDNGIQFEPRETP